MPMTEILGIPMSTFIARSTLPSDLCGRKIIVPTATDQYGGAWVMTPYMFQNQGTNDWTHKWTLVPSLAGYQAQVDGTGASMVKPLTFEQLQSLKPTLHHLLQKLADIFK